ncbi:hypothetical protein PENSPDRAFT_395295 [Peniophora sp. CONT]|nr:hypothetical protein PENSPDRAFT_395295 [Peniophora sp. CONT]
MLPYSRLCGLADIFRPNCNPTLSLRRASFLCWYCGTESPAGSKPELSLPICLLHFSLLGSPIEGEDYVLPDEDTFDFIRSEVLPAFGAEKYLARLLQTLRRDDLFDTHLNRTIKVLYRSITHPDLFAQLGPSGVLGAALDAVNRQEAHGKPGSQNASISSLMALYTLITELATDVPDARMAIPSLFLDGCYVNVVARAIRACAIDNYNLDGLSYGLCSASLTALRSCSRAMDRLRARNSSRKAMRRSVREDWYPTLDFLRRMRACSTSVDEHDQLLESWQRLGEDIGFEESVQKAEYERRMREALRHCAWKECQYHEKEPYVSLRSCKGCAEVRYCSRSCQRNDWNGGHERRCKRLKEEALSDAI